MNDSNDSNDRRLSRKAFGVGLGAATALAVGGQMGPAAVADGEGFPATGRPFVGDKETLVYDNPFHQKVGNAWYNGKIVHQLAHLNVTAERPPFKTAEQYTLVYADQFRNPVTVEGLEKQPKVPGQYVIYDSIPGQPAYSPFWHNNWVLAPRGYRPNSIRSVEAVVKSGYRIVDSPLYSN